MHLRVLRPTRRERIAQALRRPARVVEVNLGMPCDHGCHAIWCGSEAVWHLEGLKPMHERAETTFVVHGCDADSDCSTECWEDA